MPHSTGFLAIALCLLMVSLGCSGGERPEEQSELPLMSPEELEVKPAAEQAADPSVVFPPKPKPGQRIVLPFRAGFQTGYGNKLLAWSPDAHYIAVAGNGLEAELYDTESGALVKTLTPNTEKPGLMEDVAFHPNGKLIAAGGNQGILLWNIADGTVRKEWESPSVDRLAFSPDGQELIAVSSNGVIAWNLATGQKRTGPPGSYTDLATSADGKLLAVGDYDGKVTVIDAETLTVSQVISAHSNTIQAIDFSPDGLSLITVGRDEPTRRWDTKSGEKLGEWKSEKDDPRYLLYSPTGVAVAHIDDYVNLTDPSLKDNYGSFSRTLGTATLDAAFSPDGRALAIISNDHMVSISDVDTTRERASFSLPEKYAWEELIPIPWTSNFVVLESGAPPRLLDLESGELTLVIGQKEFQTDPLKLAAVFPDGKRMVAYADQSGLTIWSLEDGTRLKSLPAPEAVWGPLAVSPNGEQLAIGVDAYDPSPRIALVDVESGDVVQSFQGHAGKVRGLSFSPDGKYLASGGEDATAIIWDLASKQLVQRILAQEGPVESLQFSADGKRLLTSVRGSDYYSHNDFSVGVWDVETGRAIHILDNHPSRVVGAVLEPNGNIAVSASEGLLHVWDLSTGKLLHHLPTWASPQAEAPYRDASFVAVKLAGDQKSFVVVTNGNHFRWIEFSEVIPPTVGSRTDLLRNDIRGWSDRKHVIYSGLLRRCLGVGSIVCSLAVSQDENLLATGEFGGEVVLWDLEAIRRECDPSTRPVNPDTFHSLESADRPILKTLKHHPGQVRGLAFSPDGKRLYSADDGEESSSVCIWDLTTGSVQKEFPSLEMFIRIALSPDGKVLAVGTSDSDHPKVELYQAETGEAMGTLAPKTGVYSLAFTPNSQRLLVGTSNGITVWDVGTKEEKHTWEAQSQISGLQVLPDSINVLGVREYRAELFVYDLLTGKETFSTQPRSFRAREVWRSPDGNHYATFGIKNGTFGEIMFFDASTGVLDRTLGGEHKMPKFSSDGRLLFSCYRSALEVHSIEACFDDGLQQTLRPLIERNIQIDRHGDLFVLRIPVHGRQSYDLLGELDQFDLPLKLDFKDSTNLTDEVLEQLSGYDHVWGIRIERDARVTEAGYRTLAALPNLEELVIGTEITDQQVEVLLNCKKLRVLRLTDSSDLSEAGIRQLSKLNNLEVLELTRMPRGTDASLAQLADLEELRVLDLPNGWVTGSGLAHLRQFPKLQELDLSQTNISDQDLALLQELSSLRKLRLLHAEVTQAGVDALQEANPELSIQYKVD